MIRNKKILVGLLLFLIAGCATVTPRQDLESRRCVRVAIVSDQYREIMLTKTKEAFQEMDKKYGIAMGAWTFIKVDFDGVHSMRTAEKIVAKQIVPLGPSLADIYIVFLPKLISADIGTMLIGTPTVFGFTERFFGRFVFIRMPTKRVIRHELEHVFGSGSRSTAKIMEGKRELKFDGWYIRN